MVKRMAEEGMKMRGWEIREIKSLAIDMQVEKIGCVFAAVASESFRSGYNVENLIRRTALLGVIGIGVTFVIVTGGIDLSIGSVICLVGCGLPWLELLEE